MKKFIFIFFCSSLLLFYLVDKEKENDDEQVVEKRNSEKVMAADFYNKYATEVIPFQIAYTDYILEARLISVNSTFIKNAFTKSHDDNTIDGYENGMSVNIRYSIKTTNEKEMWIPIPMGLTITSNEFPKEDYMKQNSIHPHKDYSSDLSHFVGNELKYKRTSYNDKLYYLAPTDSIILEVQFKTIPFSESIIICGLPIFQNNTRYEKGLIIDTKQNAISGHEIFQDHYYN